MMHNFGVHSPPLDLIFLTVTFKYIISLLLPTAKESLTVSF